MAGEMKGSFAVPAQPDLGPALQQIGEVLVALQTIMVQQQNTVVHVHNDMQQEVTQVQQTSVAIHLTDGQARVARWVLDHQAEHGEMPSLTTIKKGTGCGQGTAVQARKAIVEGWIG